MDGLLPLVVAAIAAGAILLIFLGLASTPSVDPVQARLNQLGTMQAKNLEELELQAPLVDRTLRPLMARLSGRDRPRWPAPRSPSRPRSGWRSPATPASSATADWMGIKAIGAIVGGDRVRRCCSSFPGPVVSAARVPAQPDHAVPSARYLGYAIPEFWLGGRIKKRQKAILLQIPDALDLLTISVRAGLGFDGALGKVVEKLKGPLTEEFRRALAEIRVGKPRRDALRDIVPRTEVHGPHELHRRDHPGRAARRLDLQGAPGPERAAAHRAPPARRGDGGQGADQDAVPAGRVHLPRRCSSSSWARPSS